MDKFFQRYAVISLPTDDFASLVSYSTTNTFSMDVACPNLANKQTNKHEYMNCMVTAIFATANTINMHN
jgi:hypothetical protein